mgnify:CR=1 FL=1
MERRDILKASALFLGYSLVGGTSLAVLNGCQAEKGDNWKPSFFTEDEIALIAEVSERIIPKTDTPGAKDALVDRYIDEAVNNNFKPEEQVRFKSSLAVFDQLANESFQKKFVELTNVQMDEVLHKMVDASKSEESSAIMQKAFPTFKSLVVAGFFTSEIGATQALVHDPIPGPYQGCVPLADIGGTYALPLR